MKRKRFSEEQIIGILKEAEAGAKTAYSGTCRSPVPGHAGHGFRSMPVSVPGHAGQEI